MKFTKEDAIKELVAKMTAKGEKLNLSQRSIDEQVERLLSLIGNDEMESNTFVDSIMPIIKTADANVRNDISQGIKEYIEKNPKTPPTANTDVNDQLLARLEALEAKNKESELALKAQMTKNNLSNKMKELGIKNEKWVDLMLNNITITEDIDIDAKAASFLELYNSLQADVIPDVTPTGTGGGKRDYISDSIKEAAMLAKSQNLIGG